MTKVKMTNAEARSLVEVLNDLAAKDVSLSAKAWYALAKSKKGLIDKIKILEGERVRLVNKYPKKNENGDTIGVAEDMHEKFQQEFMDILSFDTEIEVHKVDINELESSGGTIQSVPNIYLMFQLEK